MNTKASGSAVSSMTGFGRAEGQTEGVRWCWEIKSVNGRGLDLKWRAPPGLDALDPKLREAAASRLKRGSIQVNLTIKRESGESALKIDAALLERLLAEGGRLHAQGLVEKPRWDGLLQVRGVLVDEDADSPEAIDPTVMEEALLDGFHQALNDLCEARRREGATMAHIIGAHITEIEDLSARAKQLAGEQPERALERLRQRIAAIAPDVAADPQRLAQEAALIAARADIAEELARLEAHADEARALLAGNGPVGRRLEFLTQELSREANTLCAKSADMALTRLGLDLKTVIEQLKEQAANVE